jgi:uncharacterized protein YbjT (DUF2867 family)
MVRILLTDAVGLIGAYTLNALLALPSLRTPTSTVANPHTILAGYHAPSELSSVPVPNPPIPGAPEVKPVLVAWDDPATHAAALRGADAVLLLTRLSGNKVADVDGWMRAIEAEAALRAAESAAPPRTTPPPNAHGRDGGGGASGERRPPRIMHVVHVGIHTDPLAPAAARPAHESWMLAAEALVRDRTAASRMTSSMLRINFDGYNGLLRPGAIAYFVPARERYGWMAREDIAALAARVLAEPGRWGGRTFPLSAQAVSLEDMARDAGKEMGYAVEVRELEAKEFVDMAGKAPDYVGYGEYVKSVAGMFEGLRKGLYPWHKEVFAERFEEVVGRRPVTFAEWLATSPMRKKLEKGGS